MILCADVLEGLASLPDARFDSCLCDPPYHLTQLSRGGSARDNDPATPFGRTRLGSKGFMGKTWDGGGVSFRPATWAEVLRVLKPGAFLFAFGGTRTYPTASPARSKTQGSRHDAGGHRPAIRRRHRGGPMNGGSIFKGMRQQTDALAELIERSPVRWQDEASLLSRWWIRVVAVCAVLVAAAVTGQTVHVVGVRPGDSVELRVIAGQCGAAIPDFTAAEVEAEIDAIAVDPVPAIAMAVAWISATGDSKGWWDGGWRWLRCVSPPPADRSCSATAVSGAEVRAWLLGVIVPRTGEAMPAAPGLLRNLLATIDDDSLGRRATQVRRWARRCG